MPIRSGIYIVPTDSWYIERSVWLIAGAVLLASTALALWVHPWFALFVAATGVSSVMVSLTGFCPVGNVLIRLGFRGKLNEERADGFYFLKTDSWYLERRIYIVVGVNITIASVLSIVHSPWWLAFTGFVGVAMFWFAATGFCIMANGLYWLGCEPRLAPRKTASEQIPAAHPARG